MLSGETYDATYHVFIDLLEQTRDVMEQFNTMQLRGHQSAIQM